MKMRYFLVLLSLGLFITACKNEETKIAEKQDQAQSHPAKSKSGNPTYKIDAIGGESTKDQIARQDIAKERQKRAAHLDTGGLKWTTFDKIAREPEKYAGKKYLVDVYTEWCGWCKVMDKKTFTDPKIQKYLRDNYTIVKFDAEQKEKVSFKGQDFEWMNGGRKGINKLALELLGTSLSYPTLVYLDEDMNKIVASKGYKKPEELMIELKRIAEM